MNLNYDIISLFLIIFIFYYLLFIISNKHVVEGNSNGDLCSGFTTCSEWPYYPNNEKLEDPQCGDNTDTCEDEIKIANCCIRHPVQMCQGNVEQAYSDYNCDRFSYLDMPKQNAVNLPVKCGGGVTSNDCWESGIYSSGHAKGLGGCLRDHVGTCNLNDLPPKKGASLCCTDSKEFVGTKDRGELITEAIVTYMNLLEIPNKNSEEFDNQLNKALEYLDTARKNSENTSNRDITELIKDWGKGYGMCMGNINETTDFQCPGSKKPIAYPFITKGESEEECCEITGMCSGNTSSTENVICPENMHLSNSGSVGRTVEACCEDDITCRGNTNIYLNYDCPVSMIPVLDADRTYGNTEEECCRYIGDMEPLEIVPSFENETIQGTISFNGDFLESVGEEDSALRVIFEKNFKKDILAILNKERKITIIEEQINIKNIYSGSIIVDFEVEPEITSGISITKEYFSYLLSGEIYFPTIELHTIGSVTNISIISWDNINYWPQWIWYVMLSSITFLIAITVMI